jgi:LPXTG-motif cell wall-anchored protein
MIFGRIAKPIFLFLIAVFVCSNLSAETKDQHLKVVLREIGHQFLLELGDSTSRILPIEKVNGRYAVKFENNFEFMPAVLSFATWKVLNESKTTDHFIVEVESCFSDQVVYSFDTDYSNDDSTVACEARELPLACYIFYFTVIENQNEPNNHKLTSLEPTSSKKSTSNSNLYFIIGALLLTTGIGVFIYVKRRKKPQKTNSDLIQIGQFQYDQKSMLLLLKAQSIELSSKESDLLFLLFSNENKTLEREYILKVVWGDEGDYVGRTLDVFVSKLRKKLEADASLKIINIRGVGYKFVIG